MTSLDIHLIGIPRLILNGEAVQPRRRHSIALLAYLVISRRTVSRSELATLLAGETPDNRALKLLRNALTDLNSHGLGDYLIISRQSVAFNFTSGCAVDVLMLDQLYAAGSSADQNSLASFAGICDQELLKGMALKDGPEFESWLLNEREHRQHQLFAIARTMITSYQLASRLHDAILLARRLLAVEPWNEELHRELMRMLARVGLFNEAREQYRVCRRAMLEELGVEPEPETKQLFETLQVGPSVPHNNFSASDWQVAGQLLGHAPLISEICSRLGDTSCRLVTLVGLRGSGKSSLATAVATSLAVPRHMVEDHPFPDGIVLVSLKRDRERAHPGQPDTAPVVEAIGRALGMAFYGNVDLLDQVTAYLDRKRILLILDGIEDVPGGISVVRTLLRDAPGISILSTASDLLGLPDEWVYYVDGAKTPESTDDVPDSAASQILIREIRRTQSRLREIDPDDLKRICQLTGGLPLALKIVAGWLRAVPPGEVIRQLEHGGELLADAVFTGSGEVVALNDLLTTEWGRLPDRYQLGISRLAVFAGQFDFKAAAAVGVSLLNLLTLCRMRVIRCHDDDTYSLHPLFRLCCRLQPRLDSDDAEEPGRLHAAYFADWIEQRSSTLREQPVEQATVSRCLPDLIAAWNWSVSRRDAALLRKMLAGLATWHSLAGKHRQWAETLTQSAAQIRETLKQGDSIEMRSVLARMLLALADVNHRLGHLDLTARALQEARLQGKIVDDPEFNALTTIRYSQVLHARGKHQDVIDLLQQARESARQAQQVSGEAYAQLLTGLALSDYGQYTRSASATREAEILTLRSGQPVSMATVHLQLGHLSAEQGDYGLARIHFDQSLHIGREFLNSYLEGWSHTYLGRLYDDGYGQHLEAARHLARASDVFAESGELSYGSYVEWALGRNAYFLGGLDRAVHHFDLGLDLGRALDSPASKSRALTGLAQVALARNDAHSAERTTQLAYQLAADAGRRPLATRARIVLGQALELLGRTVEARATFERARSEAREMGLPYIYCDAAAGLANVSLREGDIIQAGAFAAEAFDYLVDHSLAGCDNPAWVVLACSGAFSANGDIRSREAVRRGAELMLRSMETLDATSRQRFLESHPHRRELQQMMRVDRPARSLDLARITPV